MNGYSSFNSFMGYETPSYYARQYGYYNRGGSGRYNLPKPPSIPVKKKTNPLKVVAGLAAAAAGVVLAVKKGPAALTSVKKFFQGDTIKNIGASVKKFFSSEKLEKVRQSITKFGHDFIGLFKKKTV